MLERLPTRSASPLLLCAAIAAVIGLPSCGDEEEGGDAQAILEAAFSEPIESADVTFNLDAEAEGVDEPASPIRVQLAGPYRETGSDGLPSFDLDGAVQAFGAELPGIGLISTGKRLFLEVEGVAYELGDLEDGGKGPDRRREQERDAAALELSPEQWVADAEVEDDVQVAGVETTHISASVDVPALVADLGDAAALTSELGKEEDALSEDELATLAEGVESPRVDVFVDDADRVRRLAITLELDVPEEDQAGLGGIAGLSGSFSIEFADVGGDQRIAPPRSARPLRDLVSQVTGLGSLLGGPVPLIPGLPDLGGGGGRAGGDARPPSGGRGPGRSGGGGGDAAGAFGGGEVGRAFERYGRCLQQADPSDQAALDRCSRELLR